MKCNDGTIISKIWKFTNTIKCSIYCRQCDLHFY